MLGKALERWVFDELLFGADGCQKKILEAQDECLIQFEGKMMIKTFQQYP